jgi:hypothetical protein
MKRVFFVALLSPLAAFFAGQDLAFAEDTGDAVVMAQSVQQSVRNQKGQLRFCYEQRLREKPSLKGTVLVAIDVILGRVEQVAVLRNSTGDSELASCFSSRISSWRFAPDVDLVVEFPFHLKANANP